ncbi:MAG: SMC-Scp complex subunit ScpB [Dehalococcoidia bacterium]|nr:SMC-Scp complex subunit ScpB [Dehalococcoidia bacterium]
MELDSLKAVIESLLFVADGPVEISRLGKTLEADRKAIELALEAFATDCQGRGLRLQRKGDAVQMVTAPESSPYVERFLGIEQTGKLSIAALETLAAIAYLQPVTRAKIEAIRGVNSDRAIATLQMRGLVEEVGRLETVGHPALFGTTFEFLQHFGFMSLDDLPPLEGKIPVLATEPAAVASDMNSNSGDRENGEDY